MADILLSLPVVGRVVSNMAVGSYCRTLALLYESGIPLHQALELTAGAASNRVMQAALETCVEDLETGLPLSQAMRNSHMFPPLCVGMVAVGEEGGSLDAMLQRMADFYEVRVQSAIATMTRLIERLMMVFIGMLVGFLILALALPFLTMSRFL